MGRLLFTFVIGSVNIDFFKGSLNHLRFFLLLGSVYLPGFESLGSTMYLATLMLTGQGGPDNDNLPWYTKGVVLLTGVFSIGMVRKEKYQVSLWMLFSWHFDLV